jgi:GMP synthase (glutamine-hydrolysing)
MAAEREMRPKVLIVMHQAHSTPGRVGHLLTALGADLDMRRPSLDEPLPETLAGHDGVIVFGGPMGANDDCAWIAREIAWLETPLREDKPLLGICLGAQMLTRTLGGRVFNYPDQRAEIGYFPLEPAPRADALCAAPFPRQVYQWHRDGIELPDGAEPLAAGGRDFPVQAYRYADKAVALQFHPEVTYQMMCRWTVRGAERLNLPGAQPRELHLEGWRLHDFGVETWLRAFLPSWLAGALPAAQRPLPTLAVA